MSDSSVTNESLISTADAVLSVVSGESSASEVSIAALLQEIQTAMKDSVSARRLLGPYIARLSALKTALAAVRIDWSPVLWGYLAIGHRPQVRTFRSMCNLGATHLLRLLSESEQARDVGDEVRRVGLERIWLPLTSGEPPSDEKRETIIATFDAMQSALRAGGRIYIHCSAGIHRTGMITYAFLRRIQFSKDDVLRALSAMRQKTADDVGDERKSWGEQFS